MSSHHEVVNGKQRIDFSGLFRSSIRSDDVMSTTRRRRPREISPLQFEPEFEEMDAREET